MMRVSIFRQRNDARVTAACARGGVRFRVPRIACWPREEMIASLLWFVGKDVKSARRLFVQLRFERGCSQPFYHGRSSAAGRSRIVVWDAMWHGVVRLDWVRFGTVRNVDAHLKRGRIGRSAAPGVSHPHAWHTCRSSSPFSFFPFPPQFPSLSSSQSELPVPYLSFSCPLVFHRSIGCFTCTFHLFLYLRLLIPFPSPFPRIISSFPLPPWSIVPSVFYILRFPARDGSIILGNDFLLSIEN